MFLVRKNVLKIMGQALKNHRRFQGLNDIIRLVLNDFSGAREYQEYRSCKQGDLLKDYYIVQEEIKKAAQGECSKTRKEEKDKEPF